MALDIAVIFSGKAVASPFCRISGIMNRRRLFAISDPHLSFANPKPMDVFGPKWHNHAATLEDNWRRVVGHGDIVLVAGDISWAMRLEAARYDLEWLAGLPGEKILVRGNHDYWWGSLAKLKALRLPGMHYVQNNHVAIGSLAVGGSRLWDYPGITWPFIANVDSRTSPPEPPPALFMPDEHEGDPEKIRIRELERLTLSLRGMPASTPLKAVITHFPPLGEDGLPTPITDLIGSFDIDVCVFGHIHSPAAPGCTRPGEDIVIGKTRYVLASTDILDHAPKLLAEF